MPILGEECLSSHSVKQLYDLVIDVEQYPEFLPWCSDAKVVEKNKTEVIADLVINFKAFKESYRSRITLAPPKNGKARIDVGLISGPFKRLENHWSFEDVGNQTKIRFYIDFEFKSALMETLIGMVFSVACKKMVKAFEDRANDLYG
jgi:coenzyme Q-binding protein COQ10